MQPLYFPGNNSLMHLQGLVQGFWIEFNQDGVPAILLKLEASINASIIAGCSIDIVIRNPNIDNRSVTVYINDDENYCFYLLGNNFGEPDVKYQEFDEAAVKIATCNKIWLVLYNELTMPIFTTFLTTSADSLAFEDWLLQVHNNLDFKNIPKSDDGYYYPENKYTGYLVRVENIDNTNSDMTTVISYPSDLTSDQLNVESYNFSDYLGNGKHGYNQEISIKYFLTRFFELSKDLFVSPSNEDGTEFADFVILLEDSILLIESKYVISEKKTKLSNALTKAVNQLNRAQKNILTKDLKLMDKDLQEKILSKKHCIKICLYNDRLIINEMNCQNLVRTFAKMELPFFISVSTFYQLIGILNLKDSSFFKENLEFNLTQFYEHFLSLPDKILSIRRLNVNEENW